MSGANGRLFREVEFAMPVELSEAGRREVASQFAEQLTGQERLPYTLAGHRGESQDPAKPDNPHCHLMISERTNDGLERSAAQWFKRYNAADPEKGGARKSTATKPREWLENTREAWAERANQALEWAGSDERIHEGSLEDQYWDAVEGGDEREAERLKDREPGEHIGPANLAQAERGEEQALERVEEALPVKELEDEIKLDTDRAGWLEQEIERVVEQIAELVERIAERTRGMLGGDRDEPGWSR